MNTTPPSKMTSRQEQASETKKKLMNSALQLFSSQGWAGTHTRDITHAAGVADSLLYHYFPGGKRALLEAILEEHTKEILQEVNLQHERLETLPLREALEEFYVTAEAIFIRHAKVLRIFVLEPKVREFVKESGILRPLPESRAWFPQFLRRKAEQGDSRDFDYEAATETLAAVLTSDLILKVLGHKNTCCHDTAFRRRFLDYQLSLWQPLPNAAPDSAESS